jgi:hypothetical protein
MQMNSSAANTRAMSMATGVYLLCCVSRCRALFLGENAIMKSVVHDGGRRPHDEPVERTQAERCSMKEDVPALKGTRCKDAIAPHFQYDP